MGAAAVVSLGLIIWLAAPVLRHFPDAVVSWPAHGLALALLLAARRADRTWLSAAMVVSVTAGAMLAGGSVPRSVAGGTQLVAQTIVIVLLYDRLSGRRHPLSRATAYAWFLFSGLVGVLPTTLLATSLLWMIGPELVPGYSTTVWWVASGSSIAALTPLLLAPTAPVQPGAPTSRAWAWELPAFAMLYAVALANAFLEWGTPTVALPPAVASLPFLTYAALRFGVRGFALAAAMLVTVVVLSTLLAVGPFLTFGDDQFLRAHRAWVYVASLVGPAMIFPVALAERSAAESRTQSAFAQLSAIIEGSGDLIAAVDRELVIIAANPPWIEEYQRLSGITVRPGMRLPDVLPPRPDQAEDSMQRWYRALSGERFTVSRTLGAPDGYHAEYEITFGPVRDARGDVVGASQIVRNVTERRKAESGEAEARRLESIGRLAGGVAHDFNNLMTAVIGYTELIGSSLDRDDPRRADLDQIEQAARRAGELTQQLLAFARRRVIEPRLVDVGQLVENFTRLLAPLLGKQVLLAVRAEPQLRPVRLDPTQFEQVLMNLAVNARDAMPDGGRLTIELANTVRGAEPGVLLTVRDTGTGMTADVQARLFEPFFTTKPLGQGTGLGLPTVHGIVHQAGGDIAVESAVGQGTAFHVFLPAAEAQDAA